MTITADLSRRNFLSAGAATMGASLITPHLALAQSANADLGNPMYGPAPGVAKLNANENPYGPSPSAIKAMTEAIGKGAYYVNSTAETLKEMIAERHGLTKDHIILSSGSSVLTSLAMMAAEKKTF